MKEERVSFLLTFLYVPLIPLFEYLSIDAEKIMILGILLVVDFVMGISRAVVCKESVTYERALAGIVSKVFVLSIPILIALVSISSRIDLVFYVDKLIILLSIAEVYSIFDNGYQIRTKHSSGKVDMVSFIIRSIRDKLENMFRKMR